MNNYKVINKTAWKVDDKDWMKQRRAEWKDYEYNLKQQIIFEKSSFPHYKKYFLTGCEESMNSFYEFTQPILLHMWLHAENNVETFKVIAQNFDNIVACRRFFMRNTGKTKFKGLSHFNGKDLNLYKTLFPNNYTREIALEITDEEFIIKASNIYRQYMRAYEDFFLSKKINPYDIYQLTVPFWKGAFLIGYVESTGLKYLMKAMQEVYKKGNDAPEIHLKLAAEIEEVLNSSDLPEKAQMVIKQLREELNQ